MGYLQEPTEFRKQPIKTRYSGHVTGYQPIRDQYFLIRSIPGYLTNNGHNVSDKESSSEILHGGKVIESWCPDFTSVRLAASITHKIHSKLSLEWGLVSG